MTKPLTKVLFQCERIICYNLFLNKKIVGHRFYAKNVSIIYTCFVLLCVNLYYLCKLAGISEPLLEMFVTMQSVQGADWSPAHSTILATIRGSSIQIWDIQRKVYAPQSNTQSPTNSRNTKVQFTDSGRCLIVGDIDGNVHVFSLEDMPFPPFFQENLLFESFKRALITDPILLNKVKKLQKQDRTKM